MNASAACGTDHLHDLRKPEFYKPTGEKQLNVRCGPGHAERQSAWALPTPDSGVLETTQDGKRKVPVALNIRQ